MRISIRLYIWVVFILLTSCNYLIAQEQNAQYYLKLANEIIFIKPDSSRMLAEQALAKARAIENDTLAARAYFIIGTTEGVQGHYSKAQENLLRSLRIFEQYGLLKRQAATLANMARVIDAQGRYRDAIFYLKRSLALDKQFNDHEGVAIDYQDIGVIYKRSGKLDSALYYLNLAIDHAKAHNLSNEKFVTSSQEGIIAVSYYNIAGIYTEQGKYDDARKLLAVAIPYFKRIGDQYAVLEGIQYEARLEHLTGAYDRAIFLSKQSLEKAQALNMEETGKEFLKILADAYEAQHQDGEALHYFKRYKTRSDTIYNAEKARIVAGLQYDYETEKKDKEIQLLKKEEERQGFIIILVSVGAIAALFLVITLFLSKKLQTVRYREQEAHLLAEQEKAQREKIQLEAENLLHEERGRHLQLALASSERELSTTTAFLQQKNKLLEELQQELVNFSAQADQKQQVKLNDMSLALTRAKLLTEEDWEQFRLIFEKVHPGFFTRLREQFFDLTPAETRLMALTHLNLGTKEIASMLGVSDQTVYKTRQRLRAKIGRSAEKGLSDLELNAI
jgi:hypothetical protein